MLQIKDFNFRVIRQVALFGGISGFVALFCVFTPIRFLVLFSSLPLLFAYLVYGKVVGGGAASLSSILVLALAPIEASVDVVLNILGSSALLGYMSVLNVVKSRKTWWYPESLILKHFTMFSLFSVVFLSFTVCSERAMLEASQKALEFLASNGSSAFNYVIVKKYIESTVKYSVGINVLTKMCFVAFNLQLAFLLSKKMKKNIRPGYNLLDIRVDSWMVVLPLATLSLSFIFPNFAFILCGIAIVSGFAPMFCGLSFVHCLYAKKHHRRVLIAYYLALFMIPVPMIIGTVILGIIDTLCQVRDRLKLAD